jgi:hypothetical protein
MAAPLRGRAADGLEFHASADSTVTDPVAQGDARMSGAGQPGTPRTRAEVAFDWCLDNAARMESQDRPEQAAEWARYATSTAIRFGHPYLCSAPLEALLARLGAGLSKTPGAGARASGARPKRWLHVLSRTYVVGGHTAIVRRWIEQKPAAERHDIVLTYEAVKDVAPNLARCVAEAGGKIASIDDEKSALARARRLRRMAQERADVVVIHAHPADAVPALAFAAPGGPPVLLLDHADHNFWAGVACADLVIDIRDSGLHLSRALRGVTRSAVLPVPLPDPGRAPADRAGARKRLANPALLDAKVVLLTVGGEAKYLPMAHLDFGAAALEIVRQVPECVLLAVGPRRESPLWQKLHADSGGRIQAVGPDPELGAWHAAADLYLEGFPRGSYTALLEAALAGRAFVRKPHLAPPAELPIDRGALAAFEPPGTPEAYAREAVELARSPALWEPRAAQARAAVQAAHCGEGWAAALESVTRQIPARHEPQGVGAVAPLPPGLAKYWDEYYLRIPGDPLELVAKQAAARGLSALPLPEPGK